MKKFIYMVSAVLLLSAAPAKAQWVVSDPGSYAQGIINTANQIIETSATASNTLDSFKEVKKVFDQGKEFYDALKSVNNLIRDARKVQQTVLMVGDISEMYVTNFGHMLNDPNFSPQELNAIAFGYSKLLNESTALLNELSQIINASTLSMNDKERMDVIERVFKDVKNYYNLVRYYTNKNISVSYVRAKKQNDTQRVLELYGTANQKYW
jgi:DNA mismatch repair ATPase MutS